MQPSARRLLLHPLAFNLGVYTVSLGEHVWFDGARSLPSVRVHAFAVHQHAHGVFFYGGGRVVLVCSLDATYAVTLVVQSFLPLSLLIPEVMLFLSEAPYL